MTDDQRIDVVWVYMGRRELAKGGLGHAWLTDQNEETAFAKVKGRVVGGSYRVNTDEERKTIRGEPEFQPGEDLHAKTPEWDLQDRAAYVADTTRKAEARLKKDTPWEDLTLKDIRARMWTTNEQQRVAMLAIVLKKLGV